MAVNKIPENKCHPDLVKERHAASFDVEEVTELLHFGKAMNERRRELIWQALEEGVIREGPPHAFLSQEQAYSNAIQRSAVYMKKIKELDITLDNEKAIFRQIMMPFGPFPLALHISMFINALESQTTKEQKAKWLPLAQSNKIIGTYAQTELGHGTFLRALETTATYDPRTEEFIIHSPTTTSMKWWPGGLGKTANHVILMAQLFVKGVNHGMHSFIVPIRDLKTHEPLPGITVGDIGPKLGYNVMDNGFLKFDHYRIPRENMLMKNAEVTKAGEYVSKASKKLTYGAMVFIRTSIVYIEAARSLSEASTIAIRYSCIRRQSEMKPGAPEPQIMDYQTQQYKLLPQLAASYAFWFTGVQLFQMYYAFSADAQMGNTEGLPELHALSSGLKAFCSWAAMWGVEQCRLSCGGHGFSMASGIPSIYGNVATPACTYEGENTVMMLQMARYLVKIVESGQPSSSHASYLVEKHFDKCVISEQCDLPSLLAAYRSRASRQVKEAVQRLNKFRSSGKEHYEAWNLTSVDLVAAVSAHCHYVVTKSFAEAIEESSLGDASRRVLTQLCQLYATYGIVENHGHFLQGGFMAEEQLQCVRNKLFSLLSDLRPNAVALVDAFDYHDETLQSCLGRYDGHVYESLYEWAKNSPLNKTQVHESYHKYLKPMLQETTSKL